MRVVLLVPLLAAVGCAPPDLQFYDGSADATAGADGGGADGGGADAVGGDDAPAADVTTDDAHESGAQPDAAPAADSGDAPYCYGKGPPPGGKCCPNGGGPCFGTCNKASCNACGSCASPMVCCTQGASGVCASDPCGHGGDAGGDAGEGGTEAGGGDAPVEADAGDAGS